MTAVLSNSFGFGGVNACLIFKRAMASVPASMSPASSADSSLSPVQSYAFANPAACLTEALTHKSPCE